jgi:hypothetical protein
MFIHYMHLLYFFYMFRYHVHHHQAELMCPSLKTIRCYLAINYGFYSRYVVNYKRQDGAQKPQLTAT